MTAQIVDELTDKRRATSVQECVAQGIANTGTGFIGGMAGCAMIGQVGDQREVGRARGGSTSFSAGVFLAGDDPVALVMGSWPSLLPGAPSPSLDHGS